MKLLIATEAAELLRVTPNRVYELAKRNLIPSVRLGRQVRFPEEKLREWIANGGSPLPECEKALLPPAPNLVGTSRGR